MIGNVNSTFYFLQLPSIQESTKIVEAAISSSTTDEVISTTYGMISTTDEVISTTDGMISTTDEVISTTNGMISTTYGMISTTDEVISTITSMVSGNTIAFQRSITIVS
ncbi:unnamed protein product [Rotaria magnacalcarata]|uniref:Uncharacterized protein n=1 Tax=Rotaria magnacalcarata TaxID=392030 RepID=A0A820N0T3_9BILA|nr:unnamed protein product [Rotaria magnacalcarata]